LDYRDILRNRRFFNYIYPTVWIVVFLVIAGGALGFYFYRGVPDLPSTDPDFQLELPDISEPPVEDEEEGTLTKKTKHSGSGSSKEVPTSKGTATIVSDGNISDEDIDKLQGYAGAGAASSITYNDTTGRYPNLGDTLKSYLNSNLLWTSADLSHMYEIELIDCSTCSYSGLYTGSYIQDGSDITSAFGWIKLNIYGYESSPNFEDYMKLILSHEYGHHYTLYHKWVDYDLPQGERFPAEYYSVRPLDYGSTAVDYSLGWGHCEAEIIAEDYSYLFSGYGQHAMAGTYGLPSQATRTWLYSMSGATPEPEDTTAPSVSVTLPSNGSEVSGPVTIQASASDNVTVTHVDFYIDGALLAADSSAPYETSWNTLVYENGSHTIMAKAYDQYQNSETSISVTINNTGPADSEDPQVSITQPASSPWAWNSGNLAVFAEATDNVAVQKIQFLIDGVLVAEQSGTPINRTWLAEGTPLGSYTLTARAFDTSGNTADTSITVNKNF